MKEFNFEKIVLVGLTIITSVISFVFTSDLLMQEATGIREKLIVLGIVLSLEGGKYYVTHQLLTKKGNFKVNLTLCILLIFVSLVASAGYLVNKSNESVTNNKESSTTFVNKMNDIIAKEKIRDDYLKWDKVTRANTIQDEINVLRSELSNLDGASLATKGRTALFLIMSKITGFKVQYIMIVFNLLISFLTEVLAVYFAHGYLKVCAKEKENSKVNNSPVVKKDTVKAIENIETVKEVKPKVEVEKAEVEKKGIYEDNPLYTAEEMKMYIEKMYNTATGENSKISKGYQYLSKIANISATKADNIRCKLIEKGVLAKEANRTVIKKDKVEVVV